MALALSPELEPIAIYVPKDWVVVFGKASLRFRQAPKWGIPTEDMMHESDESKHGCQCATSNRQSRQLRQLDIDKPKWNTLKVDAQHSTAR